MKSAAAAALLVALSASTAGAFAPASPARRPGRALRVIPVPDPPADGDRVILEDEDGKPVIVARVGGALYATEATCPHLGLPMKKARIEADGPDGDPEIRCNFHNSCFNMRTGKCNKWVTGALGVKSGFVAGIMSKVGSEKRDLRAYDVVTDEETGAIGLE